MNPLLHKARLVCLPGASFDPQRIFPFGKGADPPEQTLAKNDPHRQDMAEAKFHVSYGLKPGKEAHPYKRQPKNNKRNKGKMRNQDRISTKQIPVITSIHINPIAKNHWSQL